LTLGWNAVVVIAFIVLAFRQETQLVAVAVHRALSARRRGDGLLFDPASVVRDRRRPRRNWKFPTIRCCPGGITICFCRNPAGSP